MDANRPLAIIGGTGVGKSTAAEQILKAELSSRSVAVLGIEKRALASNLTKWCVENSNKVVLDDLDDQEQFLPVTILQRTDDPYEQEMNTECLREALISRRGAAHTDSMPLIETVFDTWCRLVFELDLEIHEALGLFRKGRIKSYSESATFWNELTGFNRDRTLAPAERLLSILKKPTVANRLTRDGNVFIDLINDGFHFMCEGGDIVTKQTQRFLNKMRLTELIKYKQTGGQQPLTITLEESEVMGIGEGTVHALQTLRKTNCRFYLIAQSPSWD